MLKTKSYNDNNIAQSPNVTASSGKPSALKPKIRIAEQKPAPHNSALDALLESFENIFTAEELWDSLFGFTKTLGVEALAYHHLPPPGAMDFDEKIFIARGFTPESVIDYKRRHSFFSSPFENRTLSLNEPIFWSNIKNKIPYSEDQWATINNFYLTHNNGIIIPVHGPNNRNGCFILRFKDPNRRYSKAEVRKLQWICQYAHNKFCNLQTKHRKNPKSLTTREQEILTWVARGKSNSVIADIIGISQHTVNGYLRRIYLKTGTSDRTTASIRAIGEALIDY
ncbi:LuxR family transcriptional regulator [Hellea sp.]|nr:LuxR family transcriptional regulator [Hellea sp.]